MKKFITSESVTEGHPDKICDKVSDKILDTALELDKNSKMAVECTIKDNLIFIYGEATTKANLNFEKIAKEVLQDIGYEDNFNIIVKVSKQSEEINNAVNSYFIEHPSADGVFLTKVLTTVGLVPSVLK